MRNIWTDKTNLAILCARGIMPVLQQEVKDLGFEILGAEDNMLGVKSNNPARDIMTLNLYLRTAQRVLRPFFQDTRTRNLKDLYDVALNAPWEDILDINQPFVVNSITLDNPTILDTRMPTLKLKDAIVDRMTKVHGCRPSVADTVKYDIQINGKTLYSSFAPLKRAEQILSDAIEPWLEKNRDSQERVTVSIEVDGHGLMDGELPVSKISMETLGKRFTQRFGARLEQPPETAAIFLFWKGSHAKCYIDTTGTTLSRRGYRVNSWIAPMQETLAAATILSCGWDGKTPFVVPFCGSGTPAIEAALIAKNCAPGKFRSHFAFMNLKGWTQIIPGEKAGETVRHTFGATPQQIWKSMIQKAKDDEITDVNLLPKIIAVDIQADAVDQAFSNAVKAHVTDIVSFSTSDFAKINLPETAGAIYMNPPYGERLEDNETLIPLYQRIGEWLKTCKGWTAHLITSSKALSQEIKLKTFKIQPFWNASLECRLLSYKCGIEFAEEPNSENAE